jgi:hypothetical protein
MELDIPEEIALWIQKTKPESLSIIDNGLDASDQGLLNRPQIKFTGEEPPVMEERANKEYLSKNFNCFNNTCPLFFLTHYHTRNINPDHPGWGFTPGQY